MAKVRIEIHIEEDRVTVLDEIARGQNRKRKNYCENLVNTNIDEFMKLYIVSKDIVKDAGNNNA